MEDSPSLSLAPTSVESLLSKSHSPSQFITVSHAPSELMFLASTSVSASAPPQGEAQALSLASSASIAPVVNYKNRLIEYCQKSGIPMPLFQSVNEGSSHAPRFRCTVCVNGKSFTSPNTFLHRKAADQGAAKLALEQLPTENKAKATPSVDLRKLVSQDRSLCKMIVNEFAIKMNLGKCTYETVQIKEHPIPMFVSSLVLNGTHYKGDIGKNKKEAEQLVALAAVLSLLGDPTYAESMSEVIMPKLGLYAAFLGKDIERNFSVANEVVKTTSVENNIPVPLNQQLDAIEQGSSRVTVNSNMPGTANSEAKAEEKGCSQVLAYKQGDSGVSGNVNTPDMVNSQAKMKEQTGSGVPVDKQGSSGVLAYDNETLFTKASCNAPITVTPKLCVDAPVSLHESIYPHSEPSISWQTSLPIESTPSATMPGQDSMSSSSKKRRRNRKNKANKKLQTENEFGSDSTHVPQAPTNQPHPCSVAR